MALTPAEAIDTKVRTQITKKFGRKGDAVVDANMSVIRDGRLGWSSIARSSAVGPAVRFEIVGA